jgi:hypothetical protein
LRPTGKSLKTCPAPLRKIFRFRRRANQRYQLAPSFPGKRGVSRSSRTREGMRWTRQRRRETVSQGESLVSDQPARRTNDAKAYGKTVWSWHPLLVSNCRWRNRSDRIRFRHQAGSDGDKTNSSPGRARHKPSNHCAGDAGVFPLNLYARVRFFAQFCTRDRGCSAHPAFPAPSVLSRDNVRANLGQIAPREGEAMFVATSPAVIASESRTHASLRGALATKQSTLFFWRHDGLLRGACHRARIRATRWLAMTM